MKILWSSFVLLQSISAFQSAAIRRPRRTTTSTRRWTLQEPNAELETNADHTPLQDEDATDATDLEQGTLQQVEGDKPTMNVLADFAPTEDEETLSRDEAFMQRAIELAEEE